MRNSLEVRLLKRLYRERDYERAAREKSEARVRELEAENEEMAVSYNALKEKHAKAEARVSAIENKIVQAFTVVGDDTLREEAE